MLLADRAAAHAAGRAVLDAGTGVGVVALALAHLLREAGRAPALLAGIELDPTACVLAARNARDNALPLAVIRADLRRPPLRSGSFDLVTCNPPYRRPGTGRIAPDPGRALGRHEVALPLSDLLAAIARALAPGGRACLAHLPEREHEVTEAAAGHGLARVARRVVRPRLGAEPTALLLDLAAMGSAVDPAEADLVVHGDGKEFSPEVEALLRPR